MSKVLKIILSIILYLFVWFVFCWICIGINYALFGRATGAITGLGPIISLYPSYVFVKWVFWKKP